MSNFTVGLTGGIASGKSTAEKAFAALGVSVVDADAIARELVAPGQPALAEIVSRFGQESLLPDGTLNRSAMRRRVFDDMGARCDLEAIMHPRIRAELQGRCVSASGPYVIASIPLLAEAGVADAYRWLQRVLVVDCPESIQLERLGRRDGIGQKLARQMISVQASRNARLSLATDVVINDYGVPALEAAVHRLDRRFRALAIL